MLRFVSTALGELSKSEVFIGPWPYCPECDQEFDSFQEVNFPSCLSEPACELCHLPQLWEINSFHMWRCRCGAECTTSRVSDVPRSDEEVINVHKN